MFKYLKYLYYTRKYKKLNRYYYIIKAIEEISIEHTTQKGYFWTSLSHIQEKLKIKKDKKKRRYGYTASGVRKIGRNKRVLIKRFQLSYKDQN